MSVAEKMTAINDAIRGKTGKTEKLSLDEMATEINEISTGERDINPEWTDWRYFSYYDNRNDLVAKLKYNDTSKGTDFTRTFYYCSALVDLNIVGTINAIGLNVSYSTLLSHDSLMSIINALADKTGVSGTFKVTLGSTNLAKLTADEIAIAEGKGWTLA